jgi:hypothetical protein
VSGIDPEVFRQHQELLSNGPEQLPEIPTRQICPPDTPGKERIAAEDDAPALVYEANSALGVSRRMAYLQLPDCPAPEPLPVLEKLLRLHRLERKRELPETQFHRILQPVCIGRMHRDGSTRCPLQGCRIGNVIPVRVR